METSLMNVVPPPQSAVEIQDLVWYGYQTLSSILMLIFAFIGKRGLSKLDNICQKLSKLDKDGAVTETKLEDHIHNEGAHCKWPNCATAHKR